MLCPLCRVAYYPRFPVVVPCLARSLAADPAWFRTVMRHSCLFEDERIRTVKAVSWWGPTATPTAAGADPTANPQPNRTPPHQFVTSIDGTQVRMGWAFLDAGLISTVFLSVPSAT